MREINLINGDCLDKLKELEDNSVDSIVTDPPYGISFMNKQWDYDVPSVDIWKECFRVLKPGGHLLSFSGARTYHRMAVNIEDAGFEIRDQIMWVYGSGFPKSHNIGKAIDKKEIKNNLHHLGTALKPAHEPIVMARKPFKGNVADNVLQYGTGGINIDDCRVKNDGRFPANFIHDDSEEVVDLFPHTKSGKMGPQHKRHTNGSPNDIYGKFDVNHPLGETYGDEGSAARFFYVPEPDKNEGRFPANFIHDGSDEVIDLFPENKSKSGGFAGHQDKYVGGKIINKIPRTGYDDEGSAARFFYVPKANKKDRNEGCEEIINFHPTIKPTDLMKYLIRLVTPKNGTVLDPFMGSGSTGKAAVLEDFNFIGIELSEEYIKIAEKRIQYAITKKE